MLNYLKAMKWIVSCFSSKVQNFNKFGKKLLLPFCSLIVCYFVLVGFPGKAFAIDFNAGPIWDNNDAQKKCPSVCEQNHYHWHGQWTTTVPNQQSVCGCGWTLDKSEAKYKQINPAEQNNFDIFQNAIANRGLSARDAAIEMGTGSNYKNLQGNQYQIRLSQNNRVTFLVDDNEHIVKIIQVGGHT